MIENKVTGFPSSFDFGYGTKKLHFFLDNKFIFASWL